MCLPIMLWFQIFTNVQRRLILSKVWAANAVSTLLSAKPLRPIANALKNTQSQGYSQAVHDVAGWS